MSTLDRRSLFSLSTLALGGAVVPDWLARALAIQEPVAAWRVKQLREAIARAKKANRPLLVLVAPPANDRNVRGVWFGAWFESVPDEDLYLLASCELACATSAEVSEILGARVEGAPFLVLVDVGAAGDEKKPARITPVACDLPILTGEKKSADERKTGLHAIHLALVAGAKQHGLELASLAAAAMQRLDEEQKRALGSWPTGGKWPRHDLAVLAAAEVWRRIGTLAEGERKEPTALLRRAIGERIVAAPVAGARWMRDVSCARSEFELPTRAEKAAQEKAEAEARRVEEELEKDPGKLPTLEQMEVLSRVGSIMCGRGYVSPLCSRFLEFWTAGD